jgi:glycosyltransferase involved in cell wall biosynthesis
MPLEPAEPGTPEKKRILFVTQTTAYGGTEVHLFRLLKSFDPPLIQARIVCFAEDPYTHLLESIPRIQARVDRVPRPKDFRGYWSLLRRYRPEIVVFISGWHGLFPLAAYLAARLSSARRVCTIEHSTAEPRSPWPKNWVSPKSVFRWVAGWHARTTLTNALIGLMSDQTICVSEHSRMRLVREYAYPFRKTSKVWHGVEASRYCHPGEMRLATRKTLGIGAEENVLVFVGRLHRDKGPDLLFEALRQLHKDGPPCRCLVVGDGALRGELSGWAGENGLSSAVMFMGFQKDVNPYLAAADVFVLPSRTEAGPPFALLEAMSSGLACIATDVGGVPEAITDGVEGLIVPPESARGLCEGIRRLLSDANLRVAMGKRARERAQAEFDQGKSLAEMRGLLLGSRPAPGCNTQPRRANG